MNEQQSQNLLLKEHPLTAISNKLITQGKNLKHQPG